MRADRLLSMLMLLQTRGRMTAERLAEELEVSVRTVYRDIYALRVAGFPVYSERGLGGGCYLHEDYRIRLTDLTQDELAALLVMAVPTPLNDLGVGQQARDALLKLAAALPIARQGLEHHVRSRIYLDPETWNPSRKPTPTLSVLRQAVWSDRWLKVTFRRVRGITSDREIAPYGLVAKEDRWYIIWKGRDAQLHVDRASRVAAAEQLDAPFVRDEAFDLAVYWRTWSQRRQAHRSTFRVLARARSSVIQWLTSELGTERVAQGGTADADEWIPVTLLFEHFAHGRSMLLGLGAAIEVLEPTALRLSMEDFGKQIAEMYSLSRLR